MGATNSQQLNSEGQTPLWLAAHEGNIGEVRRLLSAGKMKVDQQVCPPPSDLPCASSVYVQDCSV